MTDFDTFAAALNKRITDMGKNELYVVGDALDKDSLWLTYLESFPEGTNPIYRERSEHDCTVCRNFVKNLGNVVEIVDGQVRSIWHDVPNNVEMYYAHVASQMDYFVTNLPLTGIFRSSERQYGAQKTHSLIMQSTQLETYTHFWGKVANRHFSNEVGTERGSFEATVQVLERGLQELEPAAIETVVDLIDSNSLYRGEEHLGAVVGFRSLQNKYNRLDSLGVDPNGNVFVPGPGTSHRVISYDGTVLTHSGSFLSNARRAFVFANANSPAARFRNTVIGTLVQDISDNLPLEQAVRSFEAKVAPTNYKRPKALITQSMVKIAMKTIKELGIENSLKRRFAVIGDVSVNNVLWVNNDTQARMKDGIEGLLMDAATTGSQAPKGKPEPVSIVSFMKDILPGASSVEMYVKNDHEGNFVSLTTGEIPDAPNIFKWDNPFAWSYGGNVADSIKEKVKRAGGSVTGQMRFSLSWFNYDDLDIHVTEPNGTKIWYGDKRGKLDVDMNAAGRDSREPVENVSWGKGASIQDGEYLIQVHQYSKRETIDVGFVIEIENQGNISHFSYDKAVKGGQTIDVGRAIVRGGVVIDFKPGKGIVGGMSAASRDVWGVQTETFVPVTTVMYSPNFWDSNAIGNKHWFFLLEGCISPVPLRGIYNEFLRNDLDKHRKVFEILGDKTKVQPSTDQLSGVGFSSIVGAEITARVMQGSRQRLVNIQV